MRTTRIAICAAILLGICLAGGLTVIRVRALADVESTFDKVLAERGKAFVAEHRTKTPHNISVVGSIDDERLIVDLDRRALSSSSASAYRSAFLRELKCSNPKHRGLACLMLGSSFDPELAPALAGLLGDTAEVTWRYSYACPQVTGFDPWSRETVRDYARRSLEHQTGCSFKSEDAFKRWWAKSGKDDQRKPWYLIAKWASADRHLSSPESVKHNWDVTIGEEQIREMSHLKPDSALKILLMSSYLPLGIGPASDVPPCGYVSFRYDTKAIARFVRAQGLKEKLVALLHQKSLYPEIDSDLRFSFFTITLMRLSKDVFSEADEATIAAAQRIRQPFKPPVMDMIIFRSQIAPKRARAILVEAMRTDPKMLCLAHELIEVAGFVEPKMILAAYKQEDDKMGYISELVIALEHHRPVSPWLIREFARDLTLTDDPSYMLNVSAQDLHELCKAANMCSGKKLIADADIAALEPRGFSGGKVPTEEDRIKTAEFERRVHANFGRIKRQLLVSLETARVNG